MVAVWWLCGGYVVGYVVMDYVVVGEQFACAVHLMSYSVGACVGGSCVLVAVLVVVLVVAVC